MLASYPAGRMNHTWPASGNPLDSSRKTNALGPDLPTHIELQHRLEHAREIMSLAVALDVP